MLANQGGNQGLDLRFLSLQGLGKGKCQAIMNWKVVSVLFEPFATFATVRRIADSGDGSSRNREEITLGGGTSLLSFLSFLSQYISH